MSVERDWITEAGLRAVCLVVRNSHRCGYVEVPVGHPLYGVHYSEGVEALGPSSWGAGHASPDDRITVHGGISYAEGNGKYPVESDGWWFGFDCAHAGDGTMDHRYRFAFEGPVRLESYVVRECESLARQLVALGGKA